MHIAPSRGLRVLIVEDEIIIALDLADMMADLGHTVVKIANRVESGLEFAANGIVDLAILDMNVRDELSFPIAVVLRERDIPFIFASGYGKRGLIEGFKDAHVLSKPYSIDVLAQMVRTATV